MTKRRQKHVLPRMAIAFASLLLLLFLPAKAYASEHTLSTPSYTEMENILAGDGDTDIKISLYDTTDFSGTLVIPAGKTVTLTSENGATLNASSGMRHIEVNGTLVLENLVLDGLYDGGGIVVNADGALTLLDTTIQHCTSKNGGAIFIESKATFDMQGGTILDNHATENGGGIYLEGKSKLDIQGGAVVDNHATENGGGIYASGGSKYTANLNLTNVRIAQNSADGVKYSNFSGGGGGIYARQSTVTLTGTDVIDNYTTGTDGGVGGGLFTGTNTTLTVSGGAICGNNSSKWGGGVFCGGATCTFQNVSIEDNRTKSSGGGLYAYSTELHMENCTITKNSSDGNCGGIAMGYHGNVDLIGCFVTENQAGTSGGGIGCISFDGNSLNISKSLVSGNQARQGSGGALYLGQSQSSIAEKGVHATITDSVISGNYAARNGGGIHVSESSKLTLQDHTQIINNQCLLEGGGIYTARHASSYQLAPGDDSYGNLTTDFTTVFADNNASGLYQLPEYMIDQYPGIQWQSTSADDALNPVHPINNYDINYQNDSPLALITVTYNPGDGMGAQYPVLAQGGSTHIVWAHNDANLNYSYSGYTFKGWSTSPAANGVDYVPGDPLPLQNTDITLYAVWAKPTYTVTYDPNGGLGTPYTVTLDVGTAHTALANDTTALGFTRTAHTYKGWAEAPNATKATYEANDALPYTGENGDITLYAVWQKRSSGGLPSTGVRHTVTYDANGGTGAHKDADIAHDSTYTVKEAARIGIQNDDRALVSWNTQADGKGTAFAAGASLRVTRDITLYAQWDDGTTPHINILDHVAYIIGYADGTVRPTAGITRAETATIFFRLLTDTSRAQFWATTNDFADVTDGVWYRNAISTMTNASILSGYADGTFGGDRNITRAEFAAIAARFDSTPYEGADKFTDITGHWAAQYINRAAQAGWIAGYEDGTFRPEQEITRAETITLINRMLGRGCTLESLPSQMAWTDCTPDAWYYHAVLEATTSHEYTRDSDGVDTCTKVLEAPDWASLEKTWSRPPFSFY